MDEHRRPAPPRPRTTDGEDFSVRPYALTRGRTRHGNGPALPLEALVQGLARPTVSDTPEQRRILALCAEKFESVAEISAHLHLPIGVVRIVVGDLMESGQVRVHGLTSPTSTSSALSLSVLESVLDGITSL